MLESMRLLVAKPKTKPPAANAVVATNCRLETLGKGRSIRLGLTQLKRVCYVIIRLIVTLACVCAFDLCCGLLTFCTNIGSKL
jgi:hypothetical protein